MFLEPEPKKGTSSSPFFSAQMPAEHPGDQRWRIRRKPLQERSPSQHNQQSPTRRSAHEQQKPTVRLVKQSPSPSHPPRSSASHPRRSVSDSDIEDIQTAKEITVQRYSGGAQPHLSHLSLVQDASPSKPGFHRQGVSDSDTSTNDAQKLDLPSSITLLPKASPHVDSKTAWHRRSGSSGNYSNSSTLKEGDSSLVAHSDRSASARLSQGTTLRGTPTPYEQDQPVRIEEADEEGDVQGPAYALQTLQETATERPTIRAVPPSVKSSSTEDQLGSGPSESSLPRPQSAPTASDSEEAPPIPRKSSRRRSSASDIPAPLHVRKVSASSPPPLREQPSQVSFAQSEATFPDASSPIVVIFDSDPLRPRSSSQPLRYTPSIESIQERLQYPSVIRPGTGRSLTNSGSSPPLRYFPSIESIQERLDLRPETGRSIANSSSWASLRPASSSDTLASLHVPKRRLIQRPQSLPLGGISTFASDNSRMDDYDDLPYPRQQFSSHLSTIASESDRQSRSTSRQLSHFSLGSGVLTGDEVSAHLSGHWGRQRGESAPLSFVSAAPDGSSPEEEPGDMTLGIYREESAKPQPLFKRSPSAPGDRLERLKYDEKYDGPLPPIPPIPKSRDSEENFDSVSALHSPALRPSRSGYSLRQRSNSTPSRSNSQSQHHTNRTSYVDSERWSHGSSIFPTWAKHFYGGTAALASKVSVVTAGGSRRHRLQHERTDSQWTDRSITSRLGTGYSEIEGTNSPTSSHFLPSIFCPRARPKDQINSGSRKSKRSQRSQRSRPSAVEGDGSRPDSLAIWNNTLPDSREGHALETTPSGQPKFGELKDSPAAGSGPEGRPLPRKYMKQKQWDEMEFPRPMTKDRLSDFGLEHPHLAPSRRQPSRMSAWRPPSFVESLDTLIHSRCNRQILLFALGFLCPLLWIVAAFLPLPKRMWDAQDAEKVVGGSEEDVQMAMFKHEAGDAERRWREEKQWMKARWWRTLNRIMSIIGVLVIGAVIAIAVVASK